MTIHTTTTTSTGSLLDKYDAQTRFICVKWNDFHFKFKKEENVQELVKKKNILLKPYNQRRLETNLNQYEVIGKARVEPAVLGRSPLSSQSKTPGINTTLVLLFRQPKLGSNKRVAVHYINSSISQQIKINESPKRVSDIDFSIHSFRNKKHFP